MAKRTRLVDVAESAGVSIATVSFVLSGSRKGRTQPASEETARRIREAADKLGYVPNRHAQAVRKGYSAAVTLALGSPEDPWSAQVAIEVQRRASRHGLLTLSLVDDAWFDFLKGFTPRVAFIASVDSEPDGLAHVDELAANGANLVVFSTRASATRYDVIDSSPMPAVRDAYARLRRRHERVHALSTVALEEAHPSNRMHAYVAAAQEHGDGDVSSLLVPTGTRLPGVVRACHRLLDDRPEAVVCSTGYLANMLRDVALSRSIRLPEDLEIIAIGDIPHNDMTFLGPISHYGTPNVFGRIGDIVVNRATHPNGPYQHHQFIWEYSLGITTLPD